MAKKFIPNGDSDFAVMAELFARGIADDPTTYGLSPDDSAVLTSTVSRFREALTAASYGGRSSVATARKEAARGEAEVLIRRLAHSIRANPKIDAIARMSIGMRERSASPKVEHVPYEAPELYFQRAIHQPGNAPEHELTFGTKDRKPKPAGATRLELFVDLIPADAHPNTYYTPETRTRPIYVRSYTKSPIRIVPPMADRAMRVVYFARWADASGEVGPIGKPAMGWVEGGTHHLMGPKLGDAEQRPMAWRAIDDDSRSHETTVVIALVAAAQLTDARPAVMRQIEGSIEEAA